MDKTYICSICHTLNHASRFHCQCCGTIPAQYSLIGVPSIIKSGNILNTPVVVAHGAVRQAEHHNGSVSLKTVTADYYAEA